MSARHVLSLLGISAIPALAAWGFGCTVRQSVGAGAAGLFVVLLVALPFVLRKQ